MTPRALALSLVLLASCFSSALLSAAVYQLDHDPIGRVVGEVRVRSAISTLAEGSIRERRRAVLLLSAELGREDAEDALYRALANDPSSLVRAEAALALRFHHKRPVPAVRETFRLAYRR